MALCRKEIRMRVSLLALVVVAIAAGPLSTGHLHAQTYPAKPIKVIVPYSPGGVADVIARTVGARIAETMGQPVFVENRAGADGIIGAASVAQAPADGYTLLLASSSLTIAPSLHSNAPALRGFAPITLVGEVPSVVIVRPSMPARSLNEFVQYAKSRPGEISYGSAGTSSIDRKSVV